MHFESRISRQQSAATQTILLDSQMKIHTHGSLLATFSLLAISSLVATNLVMAQNFPAPGGSAIPFKSTLDKYKSYTDEKIAPWKAANDEVGRIGGWRAYLKEANEVEPSASAPAPATPASPATPALPAANPHSGHGSKR